MMHSMTYMAGLYTQIFARLEALTDGWFLGLLARFVFAGVLFLYFFNSALTKLGDGVFGFLNISDAAYFQILPSVVEQYGYDAAAVPFLPYGLIVHLGTYGEIILPVLILLGLFTRGAALGMIAFVMVQSYVDIAFHGAGDETIGALFDRFHDSAISDQRALWLFPLIYLVVRGAGWVSCDNLLSKLVRGRQATLQHAAVS